MRCALSREGETLIKRAVSYFGYTVINRLSDVQIPRNTGDFRIMSRRVIEELRRLSESHGFLRGMVAYVGFKQAAVLYNRDATLDRNRQLQPTDRIAADRDQRLGRFQQPTTAADVDGRLRGRCDQLRDRIMVRNSEACWGQPDPGSADDGARRVVFFRGATAGAWASWASISAVFMMKPSAGRCISWTGRSILPIRWVSPPIYA